MSHYCSEHEHKEHDPQKSSHDDYGASKHHGHTPGMFIKKFWLSLVLTIPIVVYSDILKELFGFKAPQFFGSSYIPFVLGSVVFFYGGLVFIAGAWQEIKSKTPGMMILIALAISTAYFYSIFTLLSKKGHDLFWELATLITIMLLGHWLEMKAISGAQSALKELSKLLPDTAEIIIQNSKIKNQNDNSKFKIETKAVPLSELKINDIILVRPGSRIAADGIVVDGQSDVNESMITGESKPIVKIKGKEVIAGTINGDGALKVKITKVGEQTFLAGVMRLVEEAQKSKSRLQILSDKAAFYLTIIAVVTGGLTFVLWLLSKADFGFALERLVAVLVIACPHALGVAIPLVASISTTLAARHGFLVRQRLALELARKIDTVLFDKTGTLTKGEYGVDKLITNNLITNNQLLQLAASVDIHSEHFIAKAIVKEAEKNNLPLLSVKDFKRIAGKGIFGIINGDKIFIGGEAILTEAGISFPEDFKKEISKNAVSGKTIIYVIKNKELIGAIALADIIREESKKAIKDLKAMGIKTAMLTGDSESAAEWVAKEIDIDEYFAKVLPAEKAEKVKILQRQGLKVAMVGDGINDAPALTQADLGIAIGAGTNVAIESAGIILVRNDPRDIVKIVKLSRLTYNKMIQNLFWATGYNVLAIPLAAGALYFKGILLQPALAAILMSLSTIIVAINAVLLKRKAI